MCGTGREYRAAARELGKVRFLNGLLEASRKEVYDLERKSAMYVSTPCGRIRLLALQDRAERRFFSLNEERERLRAMIGRIQDMTLRTVLDMRHCSLMPWWKIALELECSERWLYKLHKRAVQEFCRLLARDRERKRSRVERDTGPMLFQLPPVQG